MANSIKVELKELGNADALLAQLPIMLRDVAVRKALRKAGDVVKNRARSLCPVGQSRTGRKAGKKHLRDTIGVVLRNYGNTQLVAVGPEYPAGAHGHLVEYGHQAANGTRVGPKPFMRPAGDETLNDQRSAFEGTIEAEVTREIK